MRALVKGGASLDVYQVSDTSTIGLLQLALLGENLKMVETLLELGLDPNQKDLQYETGMHHAAKIGKLELIKLLVETGKVDINAISCTGFTPLSQLFFSNQRPHNTDVVRAEGDEDEEDSGEGKKDTEETIFRDPVSEDLIKIGEYLVSKGAKVQIEDKDVPEKSVRNVMGSNNNRWGRHQHLDTDRAWLRNNVTQIVSLAARIQSKRLIDFAIKHGADVNNIDSNSQTPMDLIHTTLENVNNNIKQNKKDHVMLTTEQMKKYKKDSMEYFVLNKYKKSQLGASTFKEYQENKKKQLSTLKSQSTKLQEIKSALTKEKAKKFVNLKLTGKDSYLKDDQKNIGQSWYDSSVQEKVIFSYSLVPEHAPGMYAFARPYEEKQFKKYHELFSAIWKGDISKIENLTIKKPPSQQLHIASCCSLTGMSTLMFAAYRNDSKTLKRLLEICAEQFSPIEEVADDKDPVAINNYELANLMRYMRPKDLLRGAPRRQMPKKKIDPNAKQDDKINCLTSPKTLLMYKNRNDNTNLIHLCVNDKSNDCLQTLLSYPEDKILHNNYQPEGKKEEKGIFQELLLERESHQFTPFELAISKGNTSAAKTLLQAGGIDGKKIFFAKLIWVNQSTFIFFPHSWKFG